MSQSPQAAPQASSTSYFAAIAGVAFSITFLALLHVVLPYGAGGKEGRLAALILDRGGDIYPLSIQNVMWVVFFVGLAVLWTRDRASRNEMAELSRGYLPENVESILTLSDMPRLFRRVSTGDENLFLPRLLRRMVLQLQISRSVDQANSLLNSSLELLLHEIDLRYNLLRYMMWLIPTLGFLGTVYGISIALIHVGASSLDNANLLKEATEKLAVAFDTTLLALLMAGILVLIMHIVQGREEMALNQAGQYCLDNLINRTMLDN